MRAYSKRLKDLRRYSTYEWKYTDVDGILYVYVGITVDVNRRFADHNAEHTQYKHYSQIKKFAMSHNIEVLPYFTITHENYLADEAADYEKSEISRYRSMDNVVCLNKTKGGELGGFAEFIYKNKTDEQIRRLIRKRLKEIPCYSRSEFSDKHSSLYGHLCNANRLHLLDDIIPSSHADYENMTDEEHTKLLKTKYKTRQRLARTGSRYYTYLLENKQELLNTVFPLKIILDLTKLSDADIVGIMSKYKTRAEFARHKNSIYKYMLHEKPELLNNQFPYKNRGYNGWSKDRIIKELKKYKRRATFCRKNGKLYINIKKRFPELLDQYLPKINSKFDKWTEQQIADVLTKYKKRNAFQKRHAGLHKYLLKYHMDYFDKYLPPSPQRGKHMKYETWDNELFLKHFKKYKTQSLLHKNEPNLYYYARRHCNDLLKSYYKNHRLKRPSKYCRWSDTKIIAEMAKFQYRTDLEKQCKALFRYVWTHRKDLLDKYLPINKVYRHTYYYWTVSQMIDETKKYETVSIFKAHCSGLYKYLRAHHPEILNNTFNTHYTI